MVKTSFFYSIFLVSGFCLLLFLLLPSHFCSMSPLILYPTALASYFLSIWVVCLGYYLTHALFPCHTGPREHSANSQPAYFWCSQWMRVLLSVDLSLWPLGLYQFGLHSSAMGIPSSIIPP